MSTSRDPLRLADFPTASREDWSRRVEEETGSSPERLVDRSIEQIARHPLVGPEAEPPEDRYLGPLRDGAARVGARPWVLAASAPSGEAARTVVAAGAELLRIEGSDRTAVSPSWWIETLGPETRLLLDAGADTFLAAAEAVEAARERELDPWSGGGGFAVDPLGHLARHGFLPGSVEDAWRQAAELVAWCRTEAPSARAVRASGRAVREAGGSAVDETAVALASAIAWWRAADERGLSLGDVASTLRFEVVVGPDLFAEIARLRALRLVWAKAAAAAGGGAEQQRLWIDAVATRTDRSLLDPWVNQLRSTGSTFAAILGGADSIATSEWDELAADRTSSGRRLAVDVQHVLAEEAHLGRVADPAGGSWALESLTDDLARAVWKRFREIETAGGLARALSVGKIAAWVDESAARRRSETARRSRPLIGVSEFADLGQDPVETSESAAEQAAPTIPGSGGDRPEESPLGGEDELLAAAEAGDLFAGLVELLDGATDAETGLAIRAALWEGDPARCPSLRPVRWAEPWEALRRRARALRDADRPLRVAVVSVGAPGALRARQLFVSNLLAAGGLEAILPDRPAEDGAAAIAAFRREPSPLTVVCAVDGDWTSLLPTLAPALREAGARRVVLAGRPPDPPLPDGLVDAYAHLGGDALDLLSGLLDLLETDPAQEVLS